MTNFHKKLTTLIGGKHINEWARDHGLPPQTVHGWIKDNRVPKGANLKLLADATGKSTEWWLNDEADNEFYATPEFQRKANIEINQSRHDYKKDTLYIEHFVDVRAAAGVGQITPTDQVVVTLKVNAADWNKYVGLDHRHIKIITVYGDSMKPTLSHGDHVMVDTACNHFIDDAIYCIQQGDNLRFKRIKLKLDGSILVKSDNNNGDFPFEEYPASKAAEFNVIGRVIPIKYGMFEI